MTQAVGREAKKTELTRIKHQIDKLVTAIADGADVLTLNTRIKELEERKKNIEAERARTPENALPLLHPNMAQLYRRKVATSTQLLEDPEARDEAYEAIRSMIDEVRLVPEGRKLRIDLKGELTDIPSLCQTSKKPGQDGRAGAEQIKVVAGARSHQYRTRLLLPHSARKAGGT